MPAGEVLVCVLPTQFMKSREVVTRIEARTRLPLLALHDGLLPLLEVRGRPLRCTILLLLTSRTGLTASRAGRPHEWPHSVASCLYRRY